MPLSTVLFNSGLTCAFSDPVHLKSAHGKAQDKRMRTCVLETRACLKGTVLNMQPTVIKGIVHPKILFLTLYLLTCCPKPVLISFLC